MNLIWSANAWEDYLHWQETNKKILKRTNQLIQAIQRNPFVGIGNPEPLRYHLAGYWARRITIEHRLIYKVEKSDLLIAVCRYHYS